MAVNTNIHFSKQQIWHDYDKGGTIVDKKIPWVLDNIPSDVKSIIDVGCGNGIITNVLNDSYKVVGADMSEEALKQVKGACIRCLSDNIPVEASSYDLVFSSQLLEHLSDEQLKNTLLEFKRIARKYILVTVPNKEFLKICEIKCPECGGVFNANGHYQSFTLDRLKSLFGDDCEVLRYSCSGNRHRNYNKVLMNVKQGLGNRYYNPVKYTMCPVCGNDKFPHIKGNIISKVCNGLNKVISGKSYYWMLVLFQVK